MVSQTIAELLTGYSLHHFWSMDHSSRVSVHVLVHLEGFYFQFPKDSTSELALDHMLRECAVVATT